MTSAVKIDWDATRYAHRLPRKILKPETQAAKNSEASLRSIYPPQSDLETAGATISSPCIVVDMDGIILTWYLPGILNESRQVRSFDFHTTLQHI
jgi:hypothetical protein